MAEALTMVEREQISLGLVCSESLRKIGSKLGRHHSVIGREVARNGGRKAYRCVAAQERAKRAGLRPRESKIAANPVLKARIAEMLNDRFSPEQIANRLRVDHPDDASWRVCHETIYQSLYVQGRGELRRELTVALRTGRAKRRPQGSTREKRARIKDMVLISERPAVIEDRAVPGHWEGDLILGRNSRSQVGTLVERSTRYLMLCHLPTDRTSASMRDALENAVKRMPEELRKTLTWDQGVEMAQHANFTLATGVDVYFCDPHSPWQRGSNENTNGLIRQYLPKQTDLSTHSQDELDQIAASLNRRPRKTLGWRTPAEKLNELLSQ